MLQTSNLISVQYLPLYGYTLFISTWIFYRGCVKKCFQITLPLWVCTLYPRLPEFYYLYQICSYVYSRWQIKFSFTPFSHGSWAKFMALGKWEKNAGKRWFVFFITSALADSINKKISTIRSYRENTCSRSRAEECGEKQARKTTE